jgi:hypothetical protein
MENGREKETNRPATDAEILAIGAGLAKLARDQNKLDLRAAKNGKRAEVIAVKESTRHRGYEPGRDPGPSKISHGSDIVDEDGWESASDAESESSVDSRLAFGQDTSGGWFGWGGKRPEPPRRKTSVVDPRHFGPANSLHGIVTEPVGFGEVSWDPSTEFGQGGPLPAGPANTTSSASQASLQSVYPVATSDPSRFDAARSSVVSGSEPHISSRPGTIPLQQPQPITPVSQSLYEPTYPAPSELGILKKTSSTTGRSKSLAEAALAGVAVAAAGAAIASERRDERNDTRRDSDRDDRLVRRRNSERREARDDRRRGSRREKDKQKDSTDGPSGDKKRERRYDDRPHDDREERRGTYREERRSERSDDRRDDRYDKAEAPSYKIPVDPFQYQVEDDAFETPKSQSRPPLRADPKPTVVTVEREPDFSRRRGSSFKEQFASSRFETQKDHSELEDEERSFRGRDPQEKNLHDTESSYRETENSTAPIKIAAIGAVAAAASADLYRESKRRHSEHEHNYDDYDSRDYERREKETTKEPQSNSKGERDPVQEEADRAYREIVMARKIASQVIRSRTPSPDRSVVEKYEEDEEEEIVRIVTPPGMEEPKKKGPYDAPDADFKLDLVLEDPRDLTDASVPRIDFDSSNSGGSALKLDPDASKPRPFLNLVRPTPTPSPAPEKQSARSEPANPATPTDQDTPAPTASDFVIDSKGNVVSTPTSSTVSKRVTWGENEVKRDEVESPQDQREESITSAEVQAGASQADGPRPSKSSKRSGWGAVVAGITGASIGATVASEISKSSKPKEKEDKYDEKAPIVPHQPRGDVEPGSARSEPSTAQSSHVPGSFEDDLDFTATVAAGLQDTGFDPNIVINDPQFRRRDSPPGSNEPGRRESHDAGQHKESSTSRDIVEEPDTYFEKRGKRDAKKRDKAAQNQDSQTEDVMQFARPVVAEEFVEEPENYSGTSKKSKPKKSKRVSSTLDDAEVMTRESRRISIPIDAFEDLRNGEDEWNEPKKSKKKSKPDDERFDVPSRSIPPEAASELESPSSTKSKGKPRRKSGPYEPDLDPTEVSLPASTPSEYSRDGDEDDSKRTEKSLSRDNGDLQESRSVISEDGSRYEEPRKSKKQSSGSTKDDFEDVRSLVSAPVDDEFEYSAKTRKKDKKSSGGFFGLFSSKSEVDAGQQSPKESNDDFEDSRKKARKSRRNSVPDDGDSQPVNDPPLNSSNGNGHSNSPRHFNEDQDNGLRSDGENKSRRLTETISEEKDSFLVKAGILGAGAGLAGAAVAIAAQHNLQSKADKVNSNATPESAQSESSSWLSQQHEVLDPDITQRQFRPSIDPQYGDLLPLPPSGPSSPNVESIDYLPELPDSRPDTPETERLPRDKSLNSRRKSMQEAPVKSPSHSAVPLKFIMGNRSIPSSPGAVRSSPLQSPVVQNQDSLVFPRNRSRPTSWDNTKEYKPLYLVETNRRNSVVQENEPDDPMPELPPSQRTSRSSSELDFHDAVVEQSPEQFPSDKQERFARPLSIDTTTLSKEMSSEIFGSEQSTPKASAQLEDGESTRGDVQELGSVAPLILSAIPDTSSISLSSEDGAKPFEKRQEIGGKAAAEAVFASSIGYFASSPTHRMTSESWLNELASSSPVEHRRQPSPIEPMTKNRSSYLLQSSPLSKKAEDDEAAFDPNADSATNRKLFSYSDGDPLHSIQEREGNDIFGSIRNAQPDARAEHESAPGILSVSSDSQPTAETSQDLAGDDATVQIVPEESEVAAMTISEGVEPVDEFVASNSKRDKAKAKRKGQKIARSSTTDDISFPESSQETPRDGLTGSDAELVERSSFAISKNSKEKKKLGKSVSMDWEAQDGHKLSQQSRDSPLETFQDPSDEPSTFSEFATVTTQGKKKKDKKGRYTMPLEPEMENVVSSLADPDPMQETSREVTEPADTPKDWTPAEPQQSQKGEPTRFLNPGPEERLQEPQSDRSDDIGGELSTSGDSTLANVHRKEAVTSSALKGLITEPVSQEELVERNSLEHDIVPEFEKSMEGALHLSGVGRDTGSSAPEPQDPEAVDESFMPGSRKTKKKGKKAQTQKLDDASASEIPTLTGPMDQAEAAADVKRSTDVADDNFEQVARSGSKKNKKKKKKSQAWDPEFDPLQNVAEETRKDSDKPEGITDVGEVSQLANSPGLTSPTVAAYFPSATILHSPHLRQSSTEEGNKGYFPSAIAVLPIATIGAALIGSNLEKKGEGRDDADIATPQDAPSKQVETDELPLSQPEIDSKPFIRDGLRSGYDYEQLSLARQLQEEFSVGSKKSKKDKKKGQSLPPTPDLEASRSRGTEEATETQPRARSLSIGPSTSAETIEDASTGNQPKHIYSEDQLELARQLKAEFGSGDKKSKKDKKKRQGPSRSATYDEQAPDADLEPSQNLTMETSRNAVKAEVSAMGDGFSAGYQEDQLSLARQLQAEFGSSSKKSKKDKKRQSTSQTPTQEAEVRGDYFGQPLQTSAIDSLQTDNTIGDVESGTISHDDSRDGLAVGYSVDQLDLARQLQEEFGSGSKNPKKDKKDKKRRSLLRDSTDDVPENAQEPQCAPDAATDTSNLEATETGSNEPIAADPGEEFTFATKKKGKKGKKREVIVSNTNDKDVDKKSELLKLDMTSEPVDANPEEEFVPATKKPKKGKKGERQKSIIEDDEKDLSPISHSKGKDMERDSEPLQGDEIGDPTLGGPVDEFAFVSKKSKKGKKGKKRVDMDDQDPPSESFSKDRDMDPDVEPTRVDGLESTIDDTVSFEKRLSTEKLKIDEDDKELPRDLAEEGMSSKNSGDDMNDLNRAPGIDSTEFQADLGEDVAPTSTKEVLFATKSSKEEEKKRQSPATEESSLDRPDSQSEQAKQVLGIDAATDMPGERSESVPPKSGEADESHGNPDSPTSGETLRYSEQPTTKESDAIDAETKEVPNQDQAAISETQNIASTSHDAFTIDNTVTTVATPDDPFEDFVFSDKTHKKDKKKRKGLSGVAVEEGSEAPVPFDLGIATLDSSKAPLPIEDQLEDPVDGNLPPIQSLQDSSSKAIASETADEQVDDWGSVTVKKSKKDKKKRKSGISTPTESGSGLIGPIERDDLNEPRLELSSLDGQISDFKAPQDPQHPETRVDPFVDTFEFVTKSSEEEKKKRKSGSSTPIEDSLTARGIADTAPEVELDDSELPSLVKQVDSPDYLAEQSLSQGLLDQSAQGADYGYGTKKAKKNKKAKRGNQAEKSASGRCSPTELATSASLSDSKIQSEDYLTYEQSGENSFPSQEETATEQIDSRKEISDPVSSGLGRKASKKDKRKRQAIVGTSIGDAFGSAKAAPISWADEVEEAEVERQLPVIENIAKDESLSHIASTTQSAPVDDFSRPTKKGKKGKKKNAESTESTSIADSTNPPLGIGSPKEDPIEKESNASIVAATGAVLGGAAVVLSKSEEERVEAGNHVSADLGTTTRETGSGQIAPDDRPLSTEESDQAKCALHVALSQPSEPPRELFKAPSTDRDPSSEALSLKAEERVSISPPDSYLEPRTEERGMSTQGGSIEHEPVTPLNMTRYGHPRSLSLPVVQEESPEQAVARPTQVRAIYDVNRDSAFDPESPIPQHRGFSEDHEHIRDSGVHLRDSSPYEKAAAPSSTDDAIARLSWPAVDEERETVDLRRSQRPKVEVNTRPQSGREEAISKQPSLLQEVTGDEAEFGGLQRLGKGTLPPHHVLTDNRSLSPSQLHSVEIPTKHGRLSSQEYEDSRQTSHHDGNAGSRDSLPSQRDREGTTTGLHRMQTIRRSPKPREDSVVKQRVQRIESPDFNRSKTPVEKYGGLGIAGAALGTASSRQTSQEQRPASTPSPIPKSIPNINRLRSPDPKLRPDSVGSNRSPGTPPLRRSDRKSGDLRSLSQRSKPDLAKEAELAAVTSAATSTVNTANPTANEGRVRAKDMADVYVSRIEIVMLIDSLC